MNSKTQNIDNCAPVSNRFSFRRTQSIRNVNNIVKRDKKSSLDYHENIRDA